MTPRTFWIIFLKALGLWLLFSCILLIPQYISALFYSPVFGLDEIYFVSLATGGMFVLIVYLILRFLVLKPHIIIDKLRLDLGFGEERIDLKVSGATIISIAIIFIGGVMMANSLPELLRQIYAYFQLQTTYGISPDHSPTGWILFHFIKVFIAYCIIAYHAHITNYIEQRRVKGETTDQEKE